MSSQLQNPINSNVRKEAVKKVEFTERYEVDPPVQYLQPALPSVRHALVTLVMSSLNIDLSKHLVMATSSQAWEGSFLIVYDSAIYIIL